MYQLQRDIILESDIRYVYSALSIITLRQKKALMALESLQLG
jgi:hypothetical protein